MVQTDSQAPRIKSIIRREDTVLRLGGDGCDNAMTWISDGRQLVATIDGAGWFGEEYIPYSSRLFAINGNPENATFEGVPGYPDILLEDLLVRDGSVAAYYALNVL